MAAVVSKRSDVNTVVRRFVPDVCDGDSALRKIMVSLLPKKKATWHKIALLCVTPTKQKKGTYVKG
jgi:hypothetical protein